MCVSSAVLSIIREMNVYRNIVHEIQAITSRRSPALQLAFFLLHIFVYVAMESHWKHGEQRGCPGYLHRQTAGMCGSDLKVFLDANDEGCEGYGDGKKDRRIRVRVKAAFNHFLPAR
jgi:hypothetical protein